MTAKRSPSTSSSNAGAQHARPRAKRRPCESAAAFGGQRLRHQQLTISCLKRSSGGLSAVDAALARTQPERPGSSRTLGEREEAQAEQRVREQA
eukprot:3213781-Prymnesium_polylepis.1